MFYISYHNANLKSVIKVVSVLNRLESQIWFDRHKIELFANWSQRIDDTVSISDIAFIFLSSSYVNSTYCLEELERLQSVGAKIISLILDDVELLSVADLADFDESLDLRIFPDSEKLKPILEDIIINTGITQSPAVLSERDNYIYNLINSIELKLQETTTNRAVQLQRTKGIFSEQNYRPRGYFPQLLTQGAYSLSIDSEVLTIENLISLLDVQTNNILQGFVGTGKSTIALLLALWGAHEYLLREDAPLPVYLNLSQWEINQSFEQFMATQWGLAYEWRAWLSRNPALFIIDVDDISILQHPDYADKIIENCIIPEQHPVVLVVPEWSEDIDNFPPLSLVTVLPIDNRIIRQIAHECLPETRAKKLLTLYQSVGRDSMERQVDYVSFLIEYLTVNPDDSLHTLPPHFVSRIIWFRWQQHISPVQLPISFDEFLSILKYLAWYMLQSETPYSVHYDEVLNFVGDSALLEMAFDTGVLRRVGDRLRFSARLIQTELAAYMLLADGIYKHLGKPDFNEEHLRIPTKWDRVILSIFAITGTEQHHEIIDMIDDIDPFLAIEFAQQDKNLFHKHRHSLIDKLIDTRCKNPDAHYALIHTLDSMPDVGQTAQSLIHLMANSSWSRQQVLYELMIQLPFVVPDKIQSQVRKLDRHFDESRITLLSNYPVSRWICYLAFLIHHPDPGIQRNTICLLGDTKDSRVLPILFSLLESSSKSIVQDTIAAMLNVTCDYSFISQILEHIPVAFNSPDTIMKIFVVMGRKFSARLTTILYFPEDNHFREFYVTLNKVPESSVKSIVANLIGIDKQSTGILPQEQLEDRYVMKLSDLIQHSLHQAQDKSNLDHLLAEITGVLTQSPAPMPDKEVKSAKLVARTKSSIDHGRKTQTQVSEIANIPVELQEKLTHDDWSIRYRALQELAGYSAEGIIPRILTLAKDDRDIQVRIKALDILANLPVDRRINTVLLNALEDPDPIVIDATVDSIKKLEYFDTSRIITLLKHPNVNTVVAAIEILSVHKNLDAVRPLIDLLDDERKSANKDLPAGFYAAKTLSLIASPVALEAVHNSDYMNEPDEADVILPAVEHGHKSGSKYTLEQKVHLALLAMGGEKWELAQKATRYLRNIAKSMRGSENMQIISMLEDALKDEGWTVRQAVAEALAWIQSPSSIPAIIPLLLDTNWMVQVAAIHALVELDAQDTAPRIADLLGDPNTAVSEAAAEALGSLQNPAVVEQLHVSLGSDDEFVRLSALQSIYRILETDSTPYLLEMLHDPYNHIRWFAIKHLSIHPDALALDELARLLPDTAGPAWEKYKISDYALLALKNINTAESLSIVEEWLTHKRHKRGEP